MKVGVLAAFLIAAIPGQPADLASHSRDGNRIMLSLSDGSADLEWLSPSTFRFRRSWTGTMAANRQRADVVLNITEPSGALSISSSALRVQILKQGVLLNVTDRRGIALLTEASPVQVSHGEIVLQRSAPEKVRYFGLGPRTEESLDARGLIFEPSRPLMISSAGYAEYHVAPASYTFDMASTRADRYQIALRGSDRLDYYFYYGPSPKDILEEHVKVTGAIPPVAPSRLRSVTPRTLPSGAWMPSPARSLADYVRSIVHASMTAVLLPVFDLRHFSGPLTERAAQIGAVMPLVMNGRRDERLIPFLLTYAEEARDRGFPMIHPLPLQYPADPEAHARADQFMLGDEMLLAPILTEDPRRAVYLPMGFWTNLRTNERHKGRQTITVQAADDELPTFLRNGSILPLLQPSGLMYLHYFPSLGAEFFIYEHDLGDYSQVHAAPAADDLRLEIETRKSREYRWIVHHIAKPSRVISGSRLFTEVSAPAQLRDARWHWDSASRNLLVQTHAAQDSDEIINVSF